MRRIARHLLALAAGLVLVQPAPASVAAVPDVLDRLAVRETVLDPEVADAEQIRPYASRDTVEWTIGAFGGAEFGITELAFLRTGIDWFVRDGFSLGLQLDVGGIRVGGTGYTGAIGSAARLRWHFLRSDSCTVFAEVGCGVSWSGAPVPEAGTRFNFSPQAGLGATWALGAGVRLQAMVGWFHLSNARTSSSNPGLDAVSVYGGIGIGF